MEKGHVISKLSDFLEVFFLFLALALVLMLSLRVIAILHGRHIVIIWPSLLHGEIISR